MKTIKDRILETNGRIFSCKFRKKDGTLRSLTGRLGVEKYLKGGERSFDIDATPYVCVWDVELAKKQEAAGEVPDAYRNVNCETIVYFKCGDDAYHAGLDLERMTKDFFNWSDRKQAE